MFKRKADQSYKKDPVKMIYSINYVPIGYTSDNCEQKEKNWFGWDR